MTRPILDFEKAWAVWKTVSDRYNGKMDSEADEAMNVELERQAQASTQPLLAEIERLKGEVAEWERTADGTVLDAVRLSRVAVAEAQKLREALTKVRNTAEASPELNMNNYDEDQVSALNDAMCEVVAEARKALGGS